MRIWADIDLSKTLARTSVKRNLTIAAFLGVKDEIELIERSILHLRMIGVDRIIVCDLSSTDGTQDVLGKYRSDDFSFYSLKNAAEAAPGQEEEEWAAEAWKRYSIAPCDWVIFLDADEFWLPASGNLKDCAGFYSGDLLIVDRYNIVLSEHGPRMPNDLTPDAYGQIDLYARPVPDFRLAKQTHASSTPWIRGAVAPKIAARRTGMVRPAVGQHDMTMGPRSRREKADDLLIAHVALSEQSRFERKVANIRSIYANAGIDLSISEESWQQYGTAWHWRRWAVQPDLTQEFENNVVSDEELAALRQAGEIMSARELLRLRPPRFADAYLRKNDLLLELEYGASVQPPNDAEHDVARPAAVGLGDVRVACATTGDRLGYFGFMARTPVHWREIYGLSHFDPIGGWSLEPKSALFFPLEKSLRDTIRLTITHHVNENDAPVPARIRVNGGNWRPIEFRGGVLEIDIDLAKERRANDQNLSLTISGAPRLSILMTNDAQAELTFAAVVAIEAARISFPYEIIVVDKSSDPASAARLAEMDLPVHLISIPEPISFETAKNIAAEAARGEFLLLLGNDAFIEAGVAEALRDALSDEGVGVVGPAFRAPDESIMESSQASADGMSISPIFDVLGCDVSAFADAECISSACMMLRRADFLNVGGFMPDFELAYSEDCDLCLRLHAVGKRARRVTSASLRRLPRAESTRRQNQSALQRRLRRLTTKEEADVSGQASELEEALARFPHQPVLNCVVAEKALSNGAESEDYLANAAALGCLRPTMVAGPSVLDIRNRVSALGLPHKPLTAGGRAEFDRRELDVALVSSATFPPRATPRGAKRILHCSAPAELDDADWSEGYRRAGNLLNFDAIVTDSGFGARACAAILDRLGAPPVDIEVIPGVVDVFKPEEQVGPRRDIIVIMGPLSPRTFWSAHEIILRAFCRFQFLQKERRWRLVFVGALSSDDDAAYVEALRKLQPQLDIDIDIVVSPPRSALRRLLGQSKIYLSARGLETMPAEHGASPSAHSISSVGTAISAGCVPVVFHVGAEAEFCEARSLGCKFSDEDELAAALTQAAVLADAGGPSDAERAKMKELSPSAHAEAWARLVSRLDHDIKRSDAGPAPALIVAGCHRSGTSAMARILSLAGADLPADLMPPAADNPTGFWEPDAVAGFNESLFVARGSCWEDPFVRGSIGKISEAEVHAAYVLLEANYPGDRPIVVKDPRISILIDLWDAAARSAQYRPKYIIMVREPREVAASLARRNGFSVGKGLLIWAAYMRAAEKAAPASERLFVAFEDLVSQPLATLDRIAEAFGTVLPRRRGAEARISNFLQTSRPGKKPPLADARHLTRVIDDYFKALQAASRGAPLADAPGKRLDAWLNDFAVLFGPTFLDDWV